MNKINNFLRRNIITIFTIYLFIQPVLDIATSVALYKFNVDFTVSSLIRVVFLLFTLYYLIFVDETGEIKLDFSNAKIILDFMKKMSLGNDTPNKDLFDNFRVETKNQKYMEYYTDGLNTAIESIISKKEEKGISTLFSRGGTNISTNNAPKQEFELISYMVVK